MPLDQNYIKAVASDDCLTKNDNMGRKNYNAYIKKQKEEKKRKKKEEKKKKKEERRSLASNSTPGDMMAYLDEDGNIVSEPPEAIVKKPESTEDVKEPSGDDK